MAILINSAAPTFSHQTLSADETVIVEPNVTMASLDTLAVRSLLVNYGSLIGDNSVTGSTVRFQLGATGGTFINEIGGVVARDHNVDSAIDIAASSVTVINKGAVFSNGHGIEYLGSNVNNETITNSGQIYAALNGIFFSSTTAQTVSINNSGRIWGDANGIHLDAAQNAAPVIINSGIITGRTNSIVVSGGDRLDVTNTGTLQGDVVGASSQLADSVVNDGSIIGNVKLGSGVDSYRGIGTVSGTVFGEDGADTLSGGLSVDRLDGGNDGDTLNGGLGADIMWGRAGGDTYVVDNLGDTVDETGGDGVDTVQTSISFSLVASVHVVGAFENLTLTGSGAINGTGNGAINLILGNIAANVIDGGALGDTMRGGGGSDTYVVDSTADTVDELSNGGAGIDTVKSSVSFSLVNSAHVLGAVENLTLTGSAVTGTGNALANVIIGNAVANTLSGGVGIDTETGGLGNDVFVFNAPLNMANRDIITDFHNVSGDNDTFHLENAVMTKIGAGVGAAHLLNSAFFFSGATAHDADDAIVYNPANGYLYYDSNGNGAGGATLIAVITNKPVLTYADFVVI